MCRLADAVRQPVDQRTPPAAAEHPVLSAREHYERCHRTWPGRHNKRCTDLAACSVPRRLLQHHPPWDHHLAPWLPRLQQHPSRDSQQQQQHPHPRLVPAHQCIVPSPAKLVSPTASLLVESLTPAADCLPWHGLSQSCSGANRLLPMKICRPPAPFPPADLLPVGCVVLFTSVQRLFLNG